MYSVVCYGTYGMLHKCMSQRWSHHVHEQRSSNTEMFVDDFIPQSPVAAQKKKFIRRAIKRHYSGWRVRTVAPLCSEDSNEGVCVSRGLWRQPCLYVEDPWKLEHIHHVCPIARGCVCGLSCVIALRTSWGCSDRICQRLLSRRWHTVLIWESSEREKHWLTTSPENLLCAAQS